MSTRSDPSQEGLNESHINDMERSKWFWRWKQSDNTGFRVAVMKEWSMNVLQWVRHRWIIWMNSLEHISDTDDGLVALTPKMDGVMDQWWWPVNGTTQPGMDVEGKCHVQERLATNKYFSRFLPNSPQSLLTSTSLFLSSLRRITYACSIICPSGEPVAIF